MIDVGDLQAGSDCKPVHALRREIPEVLRRRHEAPGFAGKSGDDGPKIPRRDQEDTTWVKTIRAKLQSAERIRKMFNDIKHHNDVLWSKAIKTGGVDGTLDNVQTRILAMLRGTLREFDAADIVVPSCFL